MAKETKTNDVSYLYGVVNGKTIFEEDFQRLRSYLQDVRRAGMPIYVDTCYAPTDFSPEVYLWDGVNIVLRNSNQLVKLTGSPEKLDEIVGQLQNDLGLKLKPKSR